MSDAEASQSARVRRVVVIDADRRVRDSLAVVLDLAPGLRVVGCASRPADALLVVASELPDLVVIDPRLPDEAAGLTLLARLRATRPDLRIVVASAAPSDPLAMSIGLGADALLAKSQPVDELVDAIVRAAFDSERPDRTVVQGETGR